MKGFIVLLLGLSVVLAQQFPVPPFLEGAPAATIAEFEALLAKSNSLTDAEIDGTVDNWIASQSGSIKTRYVAFKAELKKHQAAAEAAHQAAVARFSADAKAADARLTAIANNPALTAAQKGAQIQAIMAALPTHVRQEIDTAMRGTPAQ
uniref:ANIS5_cation-bd domain-containing protein n=1 Tax=Panagrellus redivivus TaxID=6233 RepID=A0A7E4ZQ98_PANRE